MPRPERGATDRGFRDRLLALFRNRARELELTPRRLQQRLAGFEFARFHLDVSSGDPVVGTLDVLVGTDLLGFAGIPPLCFPAYPVAQHLAEKLHAYTTPRTEANTRVKSLVDMVAIAATEAVAGDALLASLHATFEARTTHPLPATFPDAPPGWEMPFARLAAQTPTAQTTNLADAVALARRFWDPVLGHAVRGKRWSPARRAWIEP